jgi:uncharacterized protein (DUF58 family)
MFMPDTPKLFDETTRRKLEQLMLHASRVRAGAIKGDRRSNKRGTSIEFADYRNYAPGDDLRRLDWNIYARSDRPLTRLYEDEEDLAVHLLLDTSASMDWQPDEGASPAADKFLFARRVFAGLGFVALAENDRLTMSTLDGALYGPVRGRNYGVGLLRYVSGLAARGTTDLNAALKAYALRTTRAGLAVVISDFFSPSGYMDGLNALLAKGCEVAVVHLLAPAEAEPPLAGDLRLIDVETGESQEVSLDDGMWALYVERVREWREGIRAECSKRGVHYVYAQTDAPWERIILQDLRRLGVVR